MDGPIAGGRRCSRFSALVVTAAFAIAGCGGGASDSREKTQTDVREGKDRGAADEERRSSPDFKRADPQRVAIVRAWANALRAGRVRKASTYFAVPAIVQNGGPAILLDTRAGVVVFNASLPCGARVRRAARLGRYTIVTFVLTERRGDTPGCGTGAGRLAATAFAFRQGKISEWRRVPVPPARSRSPRAPRGRA